MNLGSKVNFHYHTSAIQSWIDCSQNHTGEGTTDTDESPTYLSQYKITSENGKWSYTHIMQTLVDHFCNASVAGFILALLLIMLAFLVSVKQRRGPKMQPHCVQQPDQPHITTPTASVMPTCTSAFWTCSGGPFHYTCTRKSNDHMLVTWRGMSRWVHTPYCNIRCLFGHYLVPQMKD